MSGLKVSSLVQKCVFYWPELTGKQAPYCTEIKFLKFKTEVNGWFYVPFAGYNKISVRVWARYLNVFARSYLALSENTMDYVLQSYH